MKGTRIGLLRGTGLAVALSVSVAILSADDVPVEQAIQQALDHTGTLAPNRGPDLPEAKFAELQRIAGEVGKFRRDLEKSVEHGEKGLDLAREALRIAKDCEKPRRQREREVERLTDRASREADRSSEHLHGAGYDAGTDRQETRRRERIPEERQKAPEGLFDPDNVIEPYKDLEDVARESLSDLDARVEDIDSFLRQQNERLASAQKSQGRLDSQQNNLQGKLDRLATELGKAEDDIANVRREGQRLLEELDRVRKEALGDDPRDYYKEISDLIDRAREALRDDCPKAVGTAGDDGATDQALDDQPPSDVDAGEPGEQVSDTVAGGSPGAPPAEEVLKLVVDGQGQELQGAEISIFSDEAESPTVATAEDFQAGEVALRPGDVIIVSATCHKDRRFVVGDDGMLHEGTEDGPVVDSAVLENKPLRFSANYDEEDIGDPNGMQVAQELALGDLKRTLANRGIDVDWDDDDAWETRPIADQGFEVIIYRYRLREQGSCAAPLLVGDSSDATPEPTDSGSPDTSDGSGTGDGNGGSGRLEPERPRRTKKLPAKPDDPFYHSRGSWRQDYDDQWGLKRIGLATHNGGSIWPETEPVIVAVVDTGIDPDHPEFKNALWVNEGEIPGNGVDDDGNGFVDDVHGWNFLAGNGDIRDDNGHGSLVAGIIAARTDNGTGIAGVNPWARIMVLKTMNHRGEGGDIDAARAVMYAADHGARVINLSIGGRIPSGIERRAVAYARSRGAVVVVAAGNEGDDVTGYGPAGIDAALTVATTDVEDRRVGFSNWGALVDIAAPGMDILTVRARQADPLVYERADYRPGTAFVGEDRRYYRISGSSFSAPLVAGVASLIAGSAPGRTVPEIERMLLHSARDIGAPGRDQYTGYGIVDAQAALAADPAFFVDAEIRAVRAVKVQGNTRVQVIGSVNADRFRRGWLEVGAGETPAQWKQVAAPLDQPVRDGQLGLIEPAAFRGAGFWIVRVIAEHENGRRREMRFELRLK